MGELNWIFSIHGYEWMVKKHMDIFNIFKSWSSIGFVISNVANVDLHTFILTFEAKLAMR